MTRPGAARLLGNLDAPEFPTFQWVAMVLCTLLAGGGVFWGCRRAHCAPGLTTSRFWGNNATIKPNHQYRTGSIIPALGLLAWSVLGATAAIILMHHHYERGLPLAPRTLLQPLIGDDGGEGWLGDLADVVSGAGGFCRHPGPHWFFRPPDKLRP